MTAPDLSPDGLPLYGNFMRAVIVVTRASVDGAPELTQTADALFRAPLG